MYDEMVLEDAPDRFEPSSPMSASPLPQAARALAASARQAGHRPMATSPTMTLRTPKHDHVSFYGLLFDIRAKGRAVRITGINVGSTSLKEGPFTYKVFAASQPCAEIRERPECWREIGGARTTLPNEVGRYSPIPLTEGLSIPAGSVASICVHCTDNAEGVAYRTDLVPSDGGVTDEDGSIQLLGALPCFSIAPFGEVPESERAFAGEVQYTLL